MTEPFLPSLPAGFRAAVFGASGGIGGALAAKLAASDRAGAVYAGARRAGPAAGRLIPFTFDLEDAASIARATETIGADGPLHLVVVATGVLHGNGLAPEKTWRALDAASLAQAFAINTIGPALIARHVLDHLARGEKAVFAALSARVGSIADNRLGGWHAYRASKAALNMLVRTMAIELAQRNKTAIAVSLHPGTVDTRLSAPFQRGVAAEKLFTAAESAARLLRVVDNLTPEHSGGLFAWDGSRIPF